MAIVATLYQIHYSQFHNFHYEETTSTMILKPLTALIHITTLEPQAAFKWGAY